MRTTHGFALLLSSLIVGWGLFPSEAAAYTAVCERPAKVFRTSARIVMPPQDVDAFVVSLKRFAEESRARYYPLGKNGPGRVDIILSEENGPGSLQVFNHDGSGVIVAFESRCGRLDFREFWDHFLSFLASYQDSHPGAMHYSSEPITAQ